MKDELFQQLASSLKEGGAILRGKKKASRKITLEWPDARAVRETLGLSQSQFAALLGISPRTLQNWEQGHRRPVAADGEWRTHAVADQGLKKLG